MGRVRSLTVLMVSSALVLMAANAQAGNFNRPDILDVSDGSTYTGTEGTSWAWMYAAATWNSVWGSLGGTAQDANNRVRIWAGLYQPDSMKRNHRMARADQRRHMALQIRLYALPGVTMIASQSGNPEKCKGKLNADDRDRDGNYNVTPAGDDRIRARLRCPRDVLEQLAFTAVEIGAIQGLIGTSTKFNVRLP